MDTTLGHVRAKEVAQHEIQVDEIRRRAQQWRLMDCDEDTLEQMRHALIVEMEALEDRLTEADKRFSMYVDEGQPLDTEQAIQSIEQLSSEWEKLNKHLQDVNNALLERQLRARLAQRLGSEQRVNILDASVLFLIFFAVGLMLAELLLPLSPQTIALFLGIDFIICIFLIADFFLRLSSSTDRGWYFRRYWIDLVASIPFYGLLRLGRLFRITRFARLLRLLRIGRAFRLLVFTFRGLDMLGRTFQLNLLKRSVLIAVILLIVGALSISTLEGLQEASLQGLDESLWWSFTTVVTGGFADLYNPSTTTGRLVTAGLVLLGFAVTGIFTASLTSVLVGDDSTRIERNQDSMQVQLKDIDQRLDLLLGETNERLIAMETAAESLSRQTSREGVAAALVETMMRDFECLQASVHLLDSKNQAMVRLAHRGLVQVAPPERDTLGAHLTGRMVAELLQNPDIDDIDLEPETELRVTVKGVAFACPLVAAQRVLGALHIVLPDSLARNYLYNRVPMTLAHQAALAFFAADLAEQMRG